MCLTVETIEREEDKGQSQPYSYERDRCYGAKHSGLGKRKGTNYQLLTSLDIQQQNTNQIKKRTQRRTKDEHMHTRYEKNNKSRNENNNENKNMIRTLKVDEDAVLAAPRFSLTHDNGWHHWENKTHQCHLI